MIGEVKIAKWFTYRPPKADQPGRYGDLRGAGLALATLIDLHCPDSDEKSLAVGKLREAIMWANAAIAINE